MNVVPAMSILVVISACLKKKLDKLFSLAQDCRCSVHSQPANSRETSPKETLRGGGGGEREEFSFPKCTDSSLQHPQSTMILPNNILAFIKQSQR